jgi:spore maturation protein SpmA
MLNYLWLGLILLGALLGGLQGRMRDVAEGAVTGAQSAVTLAIGLIGIMALWLGAMRLAEKAGLIACIALSLRPVMRRLFPDVPADHPAMGSMVMNIAANMLGLNNAATPLGLRAMRDLEQLNKLPGTATNAMCTFLAINTSSVQLVPITAIAILASAGSVNPTAIIGTAFVATLFSTAAALFTVKFLERLPFYQLPDPAQSAPIPILDRTSPEPDLTSPLNPQNVVLQSQPSPIPFWGWTVLSLFLVCFAGFFVALTFPGSIALAELDATLNASLAARAVDALSLLAIPFLIALFPLYASLRGIHVYEEFVEGAKEGFHVGIRIIPFLVAMLTAIGMFRGGGGIELFTRLLQPAMDLVNFPSELLPMALIRPLTGSGTMAIFADLAAVHGADSLIARMAGTLFGSTETTFYVIAVYFGAVGVRRTRHAVPAGLVADAAGVIAAVIICRIAFAP